MSRNLNNYYQEVLLCYPHTQLVFFTKKMDSLLFFQI